MKITITRSGGYAGLSEASQPIDVGKLSPAVAIKVKQLLERVQFFQLPLNMAEGVIGADLPQVEITVATENSQHTVRFVEDDTPTTAALRQVVDLVLTS